MSGLPPQPKYKTCRRENDPGHAHALTFACFHRQPFLLRDRSCRWVIDAIDRARQRHQFDLWAYVLMPEHVHLLIFPTQPHYSISTILNSIKKSVSNRALAYVREHAPSFLPRMRDAQPGGKTCYRFWQRGGGYDRNLFSPKYVWTTIEYIHNNPVKRGLCDAPENWAWSSARAYLGDVREPLRIDFESLPHPPQRSQ